MMNYDKEKDLMQLIGRVFVALVFLFAGYGKIVGFAGTVAYVGTVLPFPEAVTVLAIVIEIVGALMLIVGYQTRLAAGALIVFVVVASFGFHFDFADSAQTVMFLKNTAIVGALLYIKAFGPGKYSLGMKKAA